MRIATVSASVRFSKALGDGQHKTVELGCEATLTAQESWPEAQATLYHELGQQMKTLWANGKGQNSLESHTPPVSTPSAPQHPEHWCAEHNTEFRKYSRDGRTWYSHRAGNQWCKEK
jgi:hypothetical protein